jgi:hypothetical protein
MTMSRAVNSGIGALVFAGSTMVFGALTSAHAVTTTTVLDQTLNLSQCEGSGYCGSAGTNYGTIELDVTDTGSTSHETATITVTLNSHGGELADPADATVAFDLLGTSIGNISASSNDYFSSWSAVTGPTEVDAGEDNAPGEGFGTFAYGVTCYNYFGGTCGNTVTITLTGSNLGFGSNGNGLFAAIDTQEEDPAQGAVAALTPTPLPGAFVLFGSVLFGGLGTAKWRSRKSRGSTSALA